MGEGRWRRLGLRSALEYIIQDGEYSQYFVITKWKVTFKNCIKKSESTVHKGGIIYD